MRFSGAHLKTEQGEVVAKDLSGAVTLPSRETENRWGGVIDFDTVHEVMGLLSRADTYFWLDIPGVLNGRIVLKHAVGDFLGSGNPEMYPTNN